MVPEHVATWSAAWSGYARRIRPWSVGPARRVCGSVESHLFVGAAAEFPRTNNENPHRLDVHQNGRGQRPKRGRVDLQTCAPTALLAPPPHKLCEIKHHRHHQCNLESMEEIHETRACTTSHEGRADIQKGSDDHRPTSGTNDGWQRQTHDANGSHQLATAQRFGVFVDGGANLSGWLLRRWASVGALLRVSNWSSHFLT